MTKFHHYICQQSASNSRFYANYVCMSSVHIHSNWDNIMLNIYGPDAMAAANSLVLVVLVVIVLLI